MKKQAPTTSKAVPQLYKVKSRKSNLVYLVEGLMYKTFSWTVLFVVRVWVFR